MHTICEPIVGLNEIQAYIVTSGEELRECHWDGLPPIMFGELRRHDRVAQFHIVA